MSICMDKTFLREFPVQCSPGSVLSLSVASTSFLVSFVHKNNISTMICATVRSNLPISSVTGDFTRGLSLFLAQRLREKEDRVTVFVRAGQRAIMGGTARPFVQCEVSAVGPFAKEEHKKCHGEALKKFLSDQLSVREERVTILLKNLDRSDVY
ncbi:D-dopachrome decarboxylase-like [Branchiostoma floridae x Branchiostoma japonicum]